MEKVFGNVVDKDRLKEEMIEVFKELDAILVEHSGPFATNCVIGSRWRQVNDIDEFTKDGIKILTHLVVSEDALSRFATRMTRFLGLAVDKRCHDGTTTSMLLFCRLAIISLEYMDTDFMAPQRYLWTKQIDAALARCSVLIDDLKITEDDIYAQCVEYGIDTKLEDVRAAIAYHMAMISSKGDHDLATKISYVIKSCPKKIFGMFTNTPLAIETEERYILRKQEHDLAVNANIVDHRDYNYKNDTQYLSENAVLFVTGNEIISGTMEAAFLSAFLAEKTNVRRMAELGAFGSEPWEDMHQDKHNLIIMSPMLNEPNLMQDILLFNRRNPHVKVTVFNLQVIPRLRTTFNKTIHYMAGVPLFSQMEMEDASTSLIGLTGPSVRVHFIGHVVSINNLYEKDGETYHPFYRDPELFKPYTDFANETEKLIVFAQDNITNQALDHDELTAMISFFRSLTVQTVYDIDIGGSSHDQYANRTVYEDAIGAALSAVNEGVILGGYAQLARLMNPEDMPGIDTKLVTMFKDVFLSIVESSLRMSPGNLVIKSMVDHVDYSKWSYIAADTKAYVASSGLGTYVELSHLDEVSLPTFLKMDEEQTFLLQAFGGYHEQLRRCKDMLPKLANTTHLADMRSQDGEAVR